MTVFFVVGSYKKFRQNMLLTDLELMYLYRHHITEHEYCKLQLLQKKLFYVYINWQ